MPWAFIFARVKDGRSSAARIAMMAMTTNSSIRVNPRKGRAGRFVDEQRVVAFMIR
jgi:hypothetical protein